MFTGLVQGLGEIIAVAPGPAGWRLAVRAGALARGVRRGDSVAVDGCCLTAMGAPKTGRLSFDVVPETWKRTTLRLRRPGDPVNLEKALRWGDPLGGHLVQGHVDGTGRVLSRKGARLRVALPKAALRCALTKGSIALDGVSLTIALRGPGWIEVALIPETLARTTLGRRAAGEAVNVEADLVAKAALAGRRLRLPGRPRTRRRPSRGR